MQTVSLQSMVMNHVLKASIPTIFGQLLADQTKPNSYFQTTKPNLTNRDTAVTILVLWWQTTVGIQTNPKVADNCGLTKPQLWANQTSNVG